MICILSRLNITPSRLKTPTTEVYAIMTTVYIQNCLLRLKPPTTRAYAIMTTMFIYEIAYLTPEHSMPLLRSQDEYHFKKCYRRILVVKDVIYNYEIRYYWHQHFQIYRDTNITHDML